MTQEKGEVVHSQLSLKLAILTLIVLTVALAILTDIEELNISKSFLTDSLTITHLASYVGAFWIAISTPIYYVLKRRSPGHYKSMLTLHVLSNLLAFALVTTHYVHREAVSVFLGTGVTLYVALISLVLTGIILRFSIMRSYWSKVKFVHTSMTTAFYLILIIHVVGTFVRL